MGPVVVNCRRTKTLGQKIFQRQKTKRRGKKELLFFFSLLNISEETKGKDKRAKENKEKRKKDVHKKMLNRRFGQFIIWLFIHTKQTERSTVNSFLFRVLFFFFPSPHRVVCSELG
jgi:hypothetical protein